MWLSGIGRGVNVILSSAWVLSKSLCVSILLLFPHSVTGLPYVFSFTVWDSEYMPWVSLHYYGAFFLFQFRYLFIWGSNMPAIGWCWFPTSLGDCQLESNFAITSIWYALLRCDLHSWGKQSNAWMAPSVWHGCWSMFLLEQSAWHYA